MKRKADTMDQHTAVPRRSMKLSSSSVSYQKYAKGINTCVCVCVWKGVCGCFCEYVCGGGVGRVNDRARVHIHTQ